VGDVAPGTWKGLNQYPSAEPSVERLVGPPFRLGSANLLGKFPCFRVVGSHALPNRRLHPFPEVIHPLHTCSILRSVVPAPTRVNPGSQRTTRRRGSVRIVFIADKSITNPSSHIANPATPCPPLRIDRTRPHSRANRTDAITSAAPVHRTRRIKPT
jgi:hypothetical protein